MTVLQKDMKKKTQKSGLVDLSGCYEIFAASFERKAP
jgi:hypothetical protein